MWSQYRLQVQVEVANSVTDYASCVRNPPTLLINMMYYALPVTRDGPFGPLPCGGRVGWMVEWWRSCVFLHFITALTVTGYSSRLIESLYTCATKQAITSCCILTESSLNEQTQNVQLWTDYNAVCKCWNIYIS